jgi:cephalosporin hydroxylase
MRVKNNLLFPKKEWMELKNLIYQKVFANFKLKRNIVDHFHKLYYESKEDTWKNTFWLGTPTQKCPLDLWVYQEIIFQIKPDVIIECGTYGGGSASYLASICDFLNHGEIITIDIKSTEGRPEHKRITYLLGSSTSREIVEEVRDFIKNKNRVMVILDSDHNKEHVLRELEIYSSFVSIGSYLIVEDTNINGHPVEPDFGPGPMEAVKKFLEGNKNFVTDKSKEKFYMTFSPDGFLKRVL